MRTRLTGFANAGVEVWVQNISANGLFGLSSQPLPIGSTVVVDLQHLGSAAAQVRWALGARFGAAFLKEFKLCEAELSDLNHRG